MPGNWLRAAATPEICTMLGIPAGAVGGDIVVSKVAAGPDWFPKIESTLVEEYEYELELHDVVTGIPLALTAEVRSEFDSAETGEYWVTVRDE